MSVSVSSERSDDVGVLGGEESVEEYADEAILEKMVEWGSKGQRDSFIPRRLSTSAKPCEGRRVKESEAYHTVPCLLRPQLPAAVKDGTPIRA